MACTDVLAERWMDDVIGPALVDGGVGHPLETITRIQHLAAGAWKARGVCDDCVKWLQSEWQNEKSSVWKKLDRWIDEAEMVEPK
jgi:hypothetical protein